MSRARVLIVDDSALVRQLLADVLSRAPDIEVVGAAADPYSAWEKLPKLRPDVLTLDVEMPRMDGLTFLGKLMRVHPMPVVMISSLTERGCETTLRALELGAVDFVSKPKIDVATGTVAMAEEIVAKVRAAARARVRLPRPGATAPAVRAQGTTPVPGAAAPILGQGGVARTHKLVVIGASTGGTEALRELLGALPADAPGIVVVQHMPEKFTQQFATRLDGLCRTRVSEARDGDRVLPGHVLIAPGNRHTAVERSGAQVRVRVFDAEPVNRHRPSVDVLFESAARTMHGDAVGVILTGMGNDGARGLLALRQAGAHTLAQDEASCVVFGMPKEAIALGGACEVLPLEAMAGAILSRG
jgi:two-component system chemotaxis response regulator CheB